jgi:glycine betaine/choline ABC-type transport system substrate-binding protein
MKQRVATLLLSSFIMLLTFVPSGHSCVGRILNLTVNDSPEQKIIGQIMAIYITERTGTSVNLVSDSGKESGLCPSDICIHYLNTGLSGMSGDSQEKDDQEVYSLVKEYYIENQNLVWLKPFGYKGPVEQQDASLAVPVANRESLAKFPVLDRVINKLGDLIDDAALQQLIQQAQSGDTEDIARDFLKTRNLI